MRKPLVITLDACCVIEWLKGGEQHREDMVAVGRIINQARDNKIEVVVSAAIIAEVLPKTNEDRYHEFLNALHEEWDVQALDAGTAKAVAYVREHLKLPPNEKTRKDEKTLKTVDAIHLGTAIVRKVNHLCTTDKGLLAVKAERLFQLPKYKPIRGFTICYPKDIF